VSYGETEEVMSHQPCAVIFRKIHSFVEDNKAIYKVSAQKRDRAFKEVVLEQYAFTCAVTGCKYYLITLLKRSSSHYSRRINEVMILEMVCAFSHCPLGIRSGYVHHIYQYEIIGSS